MPKPIPLSDVLDVTVAYVIRRQLQGRPTTLRQLSKRIGLGVPTIRGIMEKHQVDYVLIPHNDSWAASSTEIAIRTMPEAIAARSNLTQIQVEVSYRKIFGDEEPEPLEEEEVTVSEEDPIMAAVSNVDPYYAYRIDINQYNRMRGELFDYGTLIKEVKKRGYSGAAVLRAVGGDRMKYELVSPVWRPYVYRNRRFYHKDVLQHLNDLFKTYKKAKTAKKKKFLRAQKYTPKGQRV